MNTKAQIIEAMEDFQAGRMGTVPVTTLDPPTATSAGADT